MNGRWLRAEGAGRRVLPAALDGRLCAPLNFTVRYSEERRSCVD